MEKQQILSFIKDKLSTGQISKSDLQNLLSENEPSTYIPVQEEKENKHISIINILYVIGALIAVIGVVILIAQNWQEIGFLGRIMVTLGIAFVTYLAGLTSKGSEKRVLSQVMFLVSGILAPIGSGVLLYEANVEFSTNVVIMTSLILSLVYGAALIISRRNILLFFTVSFLTILYFSSIAKLLQSSEFDSGFISKWAITILGLTYIFVAYWYNRSWPSADTSEDHEKTVLKNILYAAGTSCVMGVAITLGGIYDILFIALVFAGFYFSVYARSAFILIISAGFLIADIFKITYRYFIDSIGWPVALIFSGFVVIGVGYLTFYLQKKFISKRNNVEISQQ